MENLFGRKILYASEEIIDEKNILEVLGKLNGDYSFNVRQIDYLHKYYRGQQSILGRTKTFNEFVNNRVVENRFREVVDFHTRYTAGDPIKYSANDPDYSAEVDMLNDYCTLEGKQTLDFDLVKWYNICGTGLRMILPKHEVTDDSPFFIATLDPRQAAVVYTARIPHVPKMCWYVTDADNVLTYSIYVKNPTGNLFLEVRNGDIRVEPYPLSELPIIEYPCGEERMSLAEVVLPICDAINNLDSNRIDGVEQAIQSLLVLTNCKLPEGFTANTIKEMGLIELISQGENKASVDQITTKLDQSNTQTLKEDLLNAIRTIASLPNTSENTSGGDNGLAVVYRNGWEGAYEAALGHQKNIDRPEYMAIKLMLEICERTGKLNIPLRCINIDYTRQHYENLATKSQVLIAMLNNDKIDPAVAYETSGLFYDPNKKWMQGKAWMESHHDSDSTTTTEIEI